MAEAIITNGDATTCSSNYNFIVTDPPFDMQAIDVFNSVNMAKHIVLISTMGQILDLSKLFSEHIFCFDFVLDTRSPKRSLNKRMPHYTHCNCCYFRKKGTNSIFNRDRKQRGDVYKKGYWPTILDAPRNTARGCNYGKSEKAMIDIVSSFDSDEIYDPFFGTGSIPIAAAHCVNIKRIIANDIVKEKVDALMRKLKFLSVKCVGEK